MGDRRGGRRDSCSPSHRLWGRTEAAGEAGASWIPLSSHLCLTSNLARKIPAGLLPCSGSSADSPRRRRAVPCPRWLPRAAGGSAGPPGCPSLAKGLRPPPGGRGVPPASRCQLGSDRFSVKMPDTFSHPKPAVPEHKGSSGEEMLLNAEMLRTFCRDLHNGVYFGSI